MKWETPDLTEEQILLLDAATMAALLARRCGIVPELFDLADPLERAAWIAAGERYDVEYAVRMGTAAQPEIGPALAQAELDGGEAAAKLGARRTAQAFAAAYKGRLSGQR